MEPFATSPDELFFGTDTRGAVIGVLSGCPKNRGSLRSNTSMLAEQSVSFPPVTVFVCANAFTHCPLITVS